MKPFCHGIAFSGGELLLGNVTNLVRPVARRLKSGRDFEEQTKSKRAGKTGAECTFSYQPTAALHFPAKLLILKTLLLLLLLPPLLSHLYPQPTKKETEQIHAFPRIMNLPCQNEGCFWPCEKNA